jgi:hypothetical protein
VCNPAAVQAAEELHARSKGYLTSVKWGEKRGKGKGKEGERGGRERKRGEDSRGEEKERGRREKGGGGRGREAKTPRFSLSKAAPPF